MPPPNRPSSARAPTAVRLWAPEADDPIEGVVLRGRVALFTTHGPLAAAAEQFLHHIARWVSPPGLASFVEAVVMPYVAPHVEVPTVVGFPAGAAAILLAIGGPRSLRAVTMQAACAFVTHLGAALQEYTDWVPWEAAGMGTRRGPPPPAAITATGTPKRLHIWR